MLSAAFLFATSLVLGQVEAKVPAEKVDEIGLLAGLWEFEGEFQGQSFKGTSWRRWAPKKTCLLMDWTSDMGVGTGIRGWDAATGDIAETWYTTEGERIEYRYTTSSGSVREGTMVISSPDGNAEKGTMRLELTGPDSYTFTAKSDKTTFSEKARRIRRLEQAAPTARDELREFEFFVGNWEAKDKDEGITIGWSFGWNRDGTLLENETQTINKEGKVTFYMSGNFGWDAGVLRVSNRGFNKGGRPMMFDWAKTGEKTWVTWGRGSSGKNPVEIIDEDTWKIGSGDNERVFKRQSAD